MILRSAGFAVPVLLSFLFLLFSASASATVRPRDVGVRLEYERGPGARQCPGEPLIRREVTAELGTDRFTKTGPWRVHAAVNRTKDGAFVATADLFDSDDALVSPMGEVVSFDCQELVKALAFWISVQLTDQRPPPPSLPIPSSSAAPPSTAPPSTAPLPPLPAVVASAPRPALPLPVAPPLFRLRLSAATGIEIGVGPTPTPVFSLNVALQSTTVPIVSLAIEGRADLPLPATGKGGTSVHAQALTGSVMMCFHAFDQGLLFGCPMFTAGVVSSGDGLSTAEVSRSHSAAGGRVGVAIPFASRRFAFTFAGDVLGRLRPFQLRLEDGPVLWQAGTLTGAVQAGVSTIF